MSRETQMLEHLRRKMVEQEVSAVNMLSDGSQKDFAEYKYLCGVIQGLRRAKMEINDLVQRYEEDLDND
jgi:hypothetical protein